MKRYKKKYKHINCKTQIITKKKKIENILHFLKNAAFEYLHKNTQNVIERTNITRLI